MAIGISACPGGRRITWVKSAGSCQGAEGDRIGLYRRGPGPGTVKVINGTESETAVTGFADIGDIHNGMRGV